MSVKCHDGSYFFAKLILQSPKHIKKLCGNCAEILSRTIPAHYKKEINVFTTAVLSHR